MQTFDKLIIGAGIYGLYAALKSAEAGQRVLVLEKDAESFMRATYVNQARVHMGYHYPRSYSTAIKSAHYFNRFCDDFGFCNLIDFQQIYATSATFSWTNAAEFQKFCDNAGIMCERVNAEKYFKPDMVDGAFLTKEYTYDAQILKKYFLDEIGKLPNVQIAYEAKIKSITKQKNDWLVGFNNEEVLAPYVLNATYAGVNEIHRLIGAEPFKIKYELCEIILCSVNEKFRDIGITVMDGPFFSIMPFGKTGYHSLTSVTFTPHKTSYDSLPTFPCQNLCECRPENLSNCNLCKARPQTAYSLMGQLARKYLHESLQFEYVKSLFSMKPILKASELDDSRPTVIKIISEVPKFVSVLSGKINTIYDLDGVLDL